RRVGRGVVDVAAHIVDLLLERGPARVVELAAREMAGRLALHGAELRQRADAAPAADDGESVGAELVLEETVESGEELALGQIAGGPEEDEHTRIGTALDMERCLLLHGVGENVVHGR